tara:strand:- start:15417 stop:16100 length:684 start_codon:yes stop_codon:yes gene_type:complete
MSSKNFLALCLRENRKIKSENLAKLTWGNYSCIDRENSLVYIKPSGVDVEKMSESDIAVIDMSYNQLSGLKCSIDTPIHVEIYRAMTHISSICHNHSTYATSFAQANRDIQMYGTTHADMFVDTVRVINSPISIYEAGDQHEKELGVYIAKNLTSKDSGAILLSSHGPFTWSEKENAVDVAIALEEIAKMAYITESLGGRMKISSTISSFHWDRKHGKGRRYGQDGN